MAKLKPDYINWVLNLNAKLKRELTNTSKAAPKEYKRLLQEPHFIPIHPILKSSKKLEPPSF